jgi:hypothetical protein
MWTVIYWLLIFWAGWLVGFVSKGWLDYKFRDYSGTIVVDKDRLREKTVYSLILDEYPEKLEFKKVVIFRVDSSEQSSDRK